MVYLPIAVDASIGMVFTLLVCSWHYSWSQALTKSAHIGAELLMGNVDALHMDDLTLMFWIFVVTVRLFAFFLESAFSYLL